MDIRKAIEKVESLYYQYHKSDDWESRSDLLSKIHDLELKIKKERCNINFRLSGSNKYYYADQCDIFRKHILKNGIGKYTADQIKESGLSFNRYSINLYYNQYGTDLKRFSSVDEMMGFVIGYNFHQSDEYKNA